MEFEKEVYVEELQKKNVVNGPYVLRVSSGIALNAITHGELIVDDETLGKFGITPSLDLVGRVLRLGFQSGGYPKDYGNDSLFMWDVLKTERTGRSVSSPILVSRSTIYQAKLRSLGFDEFICPRYDLSVLLDEREYSELVELPPESALLKLSVSEKK